MLRMRANYGNADSIYIHTHYRASIVCVCVCLCIAYKVYEHACAILGAVHNRTPIRIA